MKKIKLKSFGITEALIASVIIILILSSAVALAASSIKVAAKNDTYSIASQISNSVLEKVTAAKESARVSFDDRSGAGFFPIECFDTLKFSSLSCNGLSDFIEYSDVDLQGYVSFKNTISSYEENYFKYKVTVKKPEISCSVMPNEEIIPSQMCRLVSVDVKWSEKENYLITQKFTNWEE